MNQVIDRLADNFCRILYAEEPETRRIDIVDVLAAINEHRLRRLGPVETVALQIGLKRTVRREAFGNILSKNQHRREPTALDGGPLDFDVEERSVLFSVPQGLSPPKIRARQRFPHVCGFPRSILLTPQIEI